MKNIIKPNWHRTLFMFLLLICSLGIYAQSDISGVTKQNNWLVFSSRQALENTIATLERQVDAYVDTRPDPAEGEFFDPNPPLGDFERSIGFTNSLRMTALNFEFDQLRRGVDPADLVEYSWLMDDVLASLVDANHVLQIGADIYIAQPQNYIKIPNANEATLTSILRGDNPGKFPGVEVFGDDNLLGGPAGGCLADFSYTTSFAGSLTGTFAFTGTAPADATFLWTFGHGSAQSTQKNPAHTFPAQGDYEVCLTITSQKDSCTSFVCKTLEVNQGCIAMFDCNNTGVSGLVDFNGNLSSTTTGSIVSYQWTFGDGTTGTGASASHQYNCDGDKTVTLKITTSTGCTNTFSKQVRVASFTCCDDNVEKDASYSTGTDRKVNVKAWDVQFLWMNNVKSRMSHYKKGFLGIWWPKKAKLRTDIVGNVYLKNQTGCACTVSYSVNGSSTDNNGWRDVLKVSVGQRFNTKLNNEWRAKYWVNDVSYPDLVPQVGCKQTNCQ